MRLDKFLKISRLVKRRTLAKEACDKKQVYVNDRPAKAGTNVEPGDVINLNFGRRKMTVKVTDVKNAVSARNATNLYELIEDRYSSEEEI